METARAPDPRAFAATVRSASHVVIASDVDGTLSDIAPAPALATWAPRALETLGELDRLTDVTLALVSGRTYPFLLARTPSLTRTWRIAEHGAVLGMPGGACVVEPGSAACVALDRISALAERVAAQFSGMLVERKATGVALHLRGVPPRELPGAERAVDAWGETARQAGLVLWPGRRVLEARAGTASKATALRALLATAPRRALVIYAGDDAVDEPAIDVARAAGGLGFFVASSERPRPSVPVDAVLDSPRAWVEHLATVVEVRRARARDGVRP